MNAYHCVTSAPPFRQENDVPDTRCSRSMRSKKSSQWTASFRPSKAALCRSLPTRKRGERATDFGRDKVTIGTTRCDSAADQGSRGDLMRDRTTVNAVRPGSGQRGRLREGFDSNDLNRDGRLTLGEFLRFMGQVDEDISTEECQVAFDEIDLNRDGSIDFDDFVAPPVPNGLADWRRYPQVVLFSFHSRSIGCRETPSHESTCARRESSAGLHTRHHKHSRNRRLPETALRMNPCHGHSKPG
jgi:hypothetical protein